MSYSYFCPTRILIDSYTQTDEKFIDVDRDLFEKKAKAVIAFHLHNNNHKLDPGNICIKALTKRSTNETCDAKRLFVKTIELLIEERTTRNDIIKCLLNEVRENELLTYALNLVRHNGAQCILETTVNGGEFLAAYCYALSCFVDNCDKPVDAINDATSTMNELIVELTCCMIASSFGNAFIVYDTIAVDEAFRSLF